MQKKHLSILFLVICLFVISHPVALAKGKKEKDKPEGYQFTPLVTIPTTPVKDQASSGTCWSYATTSFIETEIMRIADKKLDLSEMFFVRYAYPEKAQKYLRYQGMYNFGEGGQAHDVLHLIAQHGFVPEIIYSGINYESKKHNHGEMADVLKGILDNSLKHQSSFTGKATEILEAALDIYLGAVPDSFVYENQNYTSNSFAAETGFNPNDYIEFTSYTCYPFNQWVDLEIPDNWSHDNYFNLPLDKLMAIINFAFENGYSVNWDGDVSEAGFSYRNGVAIVPETDPNAMENSEREKWESLNDEEKSKYLYNFSEPRNEKEVTQELRQKTFDKFKTTDDHLMHLVGTAKDQRGTMYYLTKNSWADDSNKMGGYLYMSESYIRLKTIAIQVHKDAVPENIKQLLK